MVYQMARTTDELDQAYQNELASSSDSQMGFLPEAERFSLKTLLSPRNTDPSKLSGLIVNISTSLIGKSLHFPGRCWRCLVPYHRGWAVGGAQGVCTCFAAGLSCP